MVHYAGTTLFFTGPAVVDCRANIIHGSRSDPTDFMGRSLVSDRGSLTSLEVDPAYFRSQWSHDLRIFDSLLFFMVHDGH